MGRASETWVYPHRWFLSAAVLALPFLYLPGLHSGLAAVGGLLLLSLVPASFRGLRGGSIRIGYSPIWMPLGLAFMFSLVHLVFSPDPFYSLDFLVVLLLLILFLLIMNLHDASMDPLFFVGFWCLAESAIVGVQLIRGVPALPSGTLINRNYLATLYLSFIGYNIGELAGAAARGRRAGVLWIVALISTSATLVIGSRSGVIGLVILWAVAAVLFRGMKRSAVLALLVLIIVLPLTTRNRAVTVSEHDPYSYSRVDIWKMAVKMGMDHPVAGVGPDLFGDYSTKYSFPVEGVPVRFGRLARKPHSDYLRVWAEGGAAGVFLAAFFLLAVARELMRSWRAGKTWQTLAVIPFFFQAFFHDLSISAPLILLFIVWLNFDRSEGDSPGDAFSLKGGMSRVVVSGMMLSLFVVLAWNVTQSLSDRYWNAGRGILLTRPRESEKLLEEAARYGPLNPGVARDLGYLYLFRYSQSGDGEDYRMAEKSIMRSRELNRNDPTPWLRLASLYITLAEKNPDSIAPALKAAESALGGFLELNPNNAMGTLQMARVKRMQGDIPAALKYVERALVLEPNYLQAHRERVSLLAGTDPVRVKEAGDALGSALERIKGYRPRNGYESELLK